VSVETSLVHRVVDAVLAGQAIFSPSRAMGPAERGVLAGILAPGFDRIGGSLQPGPAPPRDGRDGDRAVLTFGLETTVASGWLRLVPPVGDFLMTAVASDRAEIWRARAGRLPITGQVNLAVTRVPAVAVAGAGLGDAVVFDGVRATSFAADAPWKGRLVVGDHAAEIEVEIGGKLSVLGGFSPVQREEGNMSVSGSNTDATTVLAAASIEVVAELGRLSLRGDEVLGLVPGAVLAIGAQREAVSLRVGGELWAQGEIVDVDGELGVRITRLANR
jgi:flagellar motor switch/type III secretory pathway protein FliN